MVMRTLLNVTLYVHWLSCQLPEDEEHRDRDKRVVK